MLLAFAIPIAAILGLVFGSFMNLCLTRWPADESIVAPRSHCRSCPHTLSWWENIPLLGWLLLRGRCRACHAPIGVRYPAVELTLAVLWAYTAWSFIPELPGMRFPAPMAAFLVVAALMQAVFLWILVALAVLDTEHLWLPDWLTLPGIALGLIVFAAQPFALAWIGSIVEFPFTASLEGTRFGLWTPFAVHLGAAVLAAILMLLIRWLYQILREREGLGLGDVKLVAMLGAWLGPQNVLVALVAATLLGMIAAVAVIRAARIGKQPEGSWAAIPLPFGTFLCIGGIVSALWGERIVAAYLHFTGL